MKRSIIMLAALLCAAVLLPDAGTDIGKLRPAGLLQAYMEKDLLVLETDTEDFGKGETVTAALKDLKRRAPGIAFVDTVDYLVISEEAMEFLPELRKELRPGTDVCRTLVPVPAGDAAAYLSAHSPETSLLRVSRGEETPPLLKLEEERFALVK